MNHTTNYNLNQWEATDRVTRADFNADNTKLDAAIKAAANAAATAQSTASSKASASSVTALTSRVAALENMERCRIETITYTGTGKHGADNPTVITFSQKPAIFFIMGRTGVLFGIGDAYRGTSLEGAGYGFGGPITWNGSTASFYSNNAAVYQANEAGSNTVIAFIT